MPPHRSADFAPSTVDHGHAIGAFELGQQVIVYFAEPRELIYGGVVRRITKRSSQLEVRLHIADAWEEKVVTVPCTCVEPLDDSDSEAEDD